MGFLPYKIHKLPNQNKYSVRRIKQNKYGRPKTIRVFSKGTTLEKAQKQLNILKAAFYKNKKD